MEAIAVLFAIGVFVALNWPEPKRQSSSKAEALTKALKAYLEDGVLVKIKPSDAKEDRGSGR
ncbi:hypothetical protein [Leptolyngbya sp. PCC 6406]|uniref:hypothetical protein n=1 Tax=Leptolyngbya sp. PCC 6406 TaxID=1173264 RepID=UPI0002ACF766|nr:hypothetical protein [Leptolyngbya sp. PCC 6406]